MSMFVELVERIDAIFDPQSGKSIEQVEVAIRDLERKHGVQLVEKARIFSHLVAAEIAAHASRAA